MPMVSFSWFEQGPGYEQPRTDNQTTT